LVKKTNINNIRAGLEHVSTLPEERTNVSDRSRKRSCTPTGGANIITFDAGSTA
jgi:hypothetical protein